MATDGDSPNWKPEPGDPQSVDPQLDASLRSVASHAKAAGVCAVLGLIWGVPITTTRYEDGHLVECDWIDGWRLTFGALAVLLGILTLVRRDEYSSRSEIYLGAVSIVAGVIALLAGAGVWSSPCGAFN